jgi:hypothetical protein
MRHSKHRLQLHFECCLTSSVHLRPIDCSCEVLSSLLPDDGCNLLLCSAQKSVRCTPMQSGNSLHACSSLQQLCRPAIRYRSTHHHSPRGSPQISCRHFHDRASTRAATSACATPSASIRGYTWRLFDTRFQRRVHTTELHEVDGVKYLLLGGGGAEQDPILPGRTEIKVPTKYPPDFERVELFVDSGTGVLQ